MYTNVYRDIKDKGVMKAIEVSDEFLINNEFLNRHTDGLPKVECTIWILIKDSEGKHIFKFFKCKWSPFNALNYSEANMPSKGYLGTATVIKGEYTGNGYHAWEQNDSEFIYYSPIV